MSDPAPTPLNAPQPEPVRNPEPAREQQLADHTSAAAPPSAVSANDVIYGLEPELSVADFRAVLIRSTLAERRPIDDRPRLEQMLRHADLLVTARIAGQLVGVSRALTDFAHVTYLCDLAVDQAVQGRGIGRQLIARTHAAAGQRTMLVLLAAPKARSYYPHIGLTPHDSCWTIPWPEHWPGDPPATNQAPPDAPPLA